MLRNMLTSLIEHEQITTTWFKAKEVQRIADKLITLAKKNTNATQRRAHQILFVSLTLDWKDMNGILTSWQRPHELVPKLFGPIRERFLTRPGGYTRVLRLEPEKNDHASSAILEIVGNPKDMRFASTALTLARIRKDNLPITPITQMNVRKATAFDPAAQQKMKDLVDNFEAMDLLGVKKEYIEPPKKQFVGHGRKNKWEGINRERRKDGKKPVQVSKPLKMKNRTWQARFQQVDEVKDQLRQQRQSRGRHLKFLDPIVGEAPRQTL
jgi:large subunit ribosomal protein L17